MIDRMDATELAELYDDALGLLKAYGVARRR